MVKVAILLRGTDFLPQKEKMALIENLARNARMFVVAGDSSGPSSDITSAVKIVKRRTTNSLPMPFKDQGMRARRS